MTRDDSAPRPPHPDPGRLVAEAEWLRGLAGELVGRRGPDVVDDLVQDTLLARLRSPGPAPGREQAWLRRVASNLVSQSFRRQSARARRERMAASPERAASASDIVARAQTHRLLVEALLELDEPFRTTLLRRFFDHLNPAAIAAADGVPAATVRTRIHRGLARLRQVLTARHGGRADDWLAGMAALAAPRSIPIATTVATPSTALGLGGVLIMQKSVLLTLALVIVASVGTIAWFTGDTPQRANPDNSHASVASAAKADSGRPPTPLPAPESRQPVAGPATPKPAREQPVDPPGPAIDVRVTGSGSQRAGTAAAFQRDEYPNAVHGLYARQPGDRAVTLVDGQGTIGGLTAGAWWVAVLDANRILAQKSVEVDATEPAEVAFPLGLATIEGLVRNADGKPQAGQLVRCSLLEKGAYRCDTRTDARGSFRFEGVPAGTAWVGVYPDADFARPPRFMREFEIVDAKTHRADFGTAGPSAIWRGIVRNRLGQTVRGQAVDFRPGQLFLRSPTGERHIVPLRPDGSFEIALAPGSWHVRVRAPSQASGGTQLAKPMEIGSADVNQGLDLPWRRVAGRLVDADTGIAMRGAWLGAARVELWRVAGKRAAGPRQRDRLLGAHPVDPKTGGFEFDAVEPGGDYQLRCGAIGAKMAFALAAGQDKLTLDLAGRRPK